MTTTATRKPAPTVVLGYIIQTWKAGDLFHHDDIKCYAVKGQLPSEWEAVKGDPTNVEGRIYKTTQALRRADRRINTDHFKR
jgi:hypothetical protein